ncbi:MAG: glutathione S-transferase family protein [Alphaproteobacteria bacterium]
MKLYMHPVSTTSRPVMMFITENGIDVEMQTVDLMSGEHMNATYTAINPNQLVPVLEDGDFRLAESLAILKYLADLIDSPAYPKDLKQRARVNASMDWFNTDFYREFGYGLIYPQLFPHHKRQSDEVQSATIAWAQEKARDRLRVLNDSWIGPDQAYLCGDTLTIADFFGAEFVSVGDIIRCDLSRYANISRWIATMKALPSWASVHEIADGFAATLVEQEFARI